MKSVEVSIIIPVYNAAANIDKCVKSILRQSCKNFELLLINDGSKDDSLKIIRKYEKKYENIRVIDKQNEGVSKTRNLGIKEATGKYVMFIDNDDYIDEDYVETLLKAIKKRKVDCIYSGYRREDENGKLLLSKSYKNCEWSKNIFVVPWAKIYNRQYLLENKVEFLPYGIGEDIYFTQKLIGSGAKIEMISYIGYTWFYNNESVSNTLHVGMKKDIDLVYLFDKLKKVAKMKNPLTRYFFYRLYVWYMLYSGRQAKKANYVAEHQKIKQWLIKNNCYKTISPLSSKIKGETMQLRFCILMFKIMDALHLTKLFAAVYCKG